jgi:hypothetical protein
MLDVQELDSESAQLLPGREALGKLKFSFTKTSYVTKHIATVDAANQSVAQNLYSPDAVAQAQAAQGIWISQ